MPVNMRKKVEVNRRVQQKRRARGQCVIAGCVEPIMFGRIRCDRHLLENYKSARTYLLKRRALGLCDVPKCQNPPDNGRVRCAAHRKKWTEYHRVRLYKLSAEDFAILMELQANACAICHRAPNRFHIDHDHKTGKVRGLLCSNCNMALGFLHDDPDILAAAMRYLMKEQ